MQLVTDKKLAAFNKYSLAVTLVGPNTGSTVVEGLSVLCEAVSLVNEWRLSQVLQV